MHRRLYHAGLAPGRLTLSERESRHAATVLRCRVGDAFVLFDGCGRSATGRVCEVGRRSVSVDVDEVESHGREAGPRVTLATAWPKRGRQSFLIEKCTELGVDAIWPTVFERSVVEPGRSQVERWRRAAIEAAKQCGRWWLPEIAHPQRFEDALSRREAFDKVLLADPSEGGACVMDVVCGEPAASSVCIWIGPEGGLTDAERRAASDGVLVNVRLGAHVLRIETAAVAAVALLKGQQASASQG